jgi:hypothetical protein
MSGNSMAMGVALGRLDWPSVLQRGLPILTFFLGNMLSFLLFTQERRRGIRSPFAIVFGLVGISSCWPASGDVMCWGPSAEALSSCTWHSSPWSSPYAFSRC